MHVFKSGTQNSHNQKFLGQKMEISKIRNHTVEFFGALKTYINGVSKLRKNPGRKEGYYETWNLIIFQYKWPKAREKRRPATLHQTFLELRDKQANKTWITRATKYFQTKNNEILTWDPPLSCWTSR